MRTIKVRKGEFKVAGITNGFATYGKNAHGNYRIEAKLDWGVFDETKIKLYESKRKPIFRHLGIITVLLIPFTPFFIVGMILLSLVSIYIEGAINFVRDKAWVNSVREFTWANIVLIIILTILLILK